MPRGAHPRDPPAPRHPQAPSPPGTLQPCTREERSRRTRTWDTTPALVLTGDGGTQNERFPSPPAGRVVMPTEPLAAAARMQSGREELINFSHISFLRSRGLLGLRIKLL